MSVALQETRIGRMWVDPSAPYTVQQAEQTVFQFRRGVDIPRGGFGEFTYGSIFKYFSTDAQVTTPYVHLNFDLQSGSTGSDWTTVKEFSREIDKSTLTASREAPRPTGVMGTFTMPITSGDYYRVVMKTFGGDSTCSFSMVVGLSGDRVFRDTPYAGQ